MKGQRLGFRRVMISSLSLLFVTTGYAADWDRYKYNQGKAAQRRQQETTREVYDQIFRDSQPQGQQRRDNPRGSSMDNLMDLLNDRLKQTGHSGSRSRPRTTPRRTYSEPVDTRPNTSRSDYDRRSTPSSQPYNRDTNRGASPSEPVDEFNF